MDEFYSGEFYGMETHRISMATTYDGINYFPMGVNFSEENAMEVIEAKYGIKGSGIVLKLLCKIYKEGYYILWGEEQCIIFASKAGRDVEAQEVDDIVNILCNKGMFNQESYTKHHVLTSETIQKIWVEATKRRKREIDSLPYLLIKKTKEEAQPVPTNLPDVVQDVAVDTENVCNSGQSKVNESRENKRIPPSTPPRGTEGQKEGSLLSAPPGYAFNTQTHNYTGLMETLHKLGITDTGELNTILRLSDYGRKGTILWKLISSTCWSSIGAKGRYIIAALNKERNR